MGRCPVWVRVPPPPPVKALRKTAPFSTQYATGVMKKMYHWRAKKDSKGTLVIVHGLGEHAGRYKNLAGVFNGAGYDVVSADLPGHGKTSGPRGHIRRFEDFYSVVDEMIHASQHPVYLMGHSLGGLIALRYVEERSPGVKKTDPFQSRIKDRDQPCFETCSRFSKRFGTEDEFRQQNKR